MGTFLDLLLGPRMINLKKIVPLRWIEEDSPGSTTAMWLHLITTVTNGPNFSPPPVPSGSHNNLNKNQVFVHILLLIPSGEKQKSHHLLPVAERLLYLTTVFTI